MSDLLAGATASVWRARALLSELQEVQAPTSDAPEDAEDRSWWLCDLAPVSALDRQRLLECDATVARLTLLTGLVESVADDLRRILAGG
jgi:Lon protease-like protein